jgi:hypothetical protein
VWVGDIVLKEEERLSLGIGDSIFKDRGLDGDGYRRYLTGTVGGCIIPGVGKCTFSKNKGKHQDTLQYSILLTKTVKVEFRDPDMTNEGIAWSSNLCRECMGLPSFIS